MGWRVKGQAGGRLPKRCCNSIAVLTVMLWHNAIDALTVPEWLRDDEDRPHWIPPAAWTAARSIVDDGDLEPSGQLGFVEDFAYVEAAAQHRCRRHPDGIIEKAFVDLPARRVEASASAGAADG